MERHRALWPFSFAPYDALGVEETCRASQDSTGVAVNQLLRAAGLGTAQEAALEVEFLEPAEAPVRPRREGVMRTLRAARRAIPGGLALRTRAKALELAAERQRQDMLLGLSARLPVIAP